MRQNYLLILHRLKINFIIPQIPKDISCFNICNNIIWSHFCTIYYNDFGIKEICLLYRTFITRINALRNLWTHTVLPTVIYYYTPWIFNFIRIWTFFNQLICLNNLKELIFYNRIAEYGPIQIILWLISKWNVFERLPEIPNISQHRIRYMYTIEQACPGVLSNFETYQHVLWHQNLG